MSVVKYCPRCGSELDIKWDGGRDRPACLTDGCGFIHFGDASIGCGAVVIRGERALLIQRGIDPGRGSWQIPGGYVETGGADPGGCRARGAGGGGRRRAFQGCGRVPARSRERGAAGGEHLRSVPPRLRVGRGALRWRGDAGRGLLQPRRARRDGACARRSRCGRSVTSLATPLDAGMSLHSANPPLGRPGWSVFGVGGPQRPS